MNRKRGLPGPDDIAVSSAQFCGRANFRLP
jgi:hypothetical protein